MSRSELFSKAVAEYVRDQRFLGVRERLDAVYGAEPDRASLDPALAEIQARSLPAEKW